MLPNVTPVKARAMQETECLRDSKFMKVFPKEGTSKLMPEKEVRAI